MLCGEPYADSKVKAEKLVSAKIKDAKIRDKSIAITIVRPGFIYGPRERAWLPQLIKAIAAGRAVLIDGGNKETNTIYVENLNRAIEATLLNQSAYGQTYNLTDGQGTTKKQLFDAISKELNLPMVQKTLPSQIVKPIFVAISSIGSFLPQNNRKKLSRFSMAAYRLIGLNQGFSITKAENELGYTTRIPFSKGIAETFQSSNELAQSVKEKN
jgi:nucleoside-diphosphate-sugar epimerase